jgi:hypothetical protein
MPRNVYEDDGRQTSCGHSQIPLCFIFGLYPHLQQSLGGAFAAHSAGPKHPTTTQVICQSGEVLIRHAENSIAGIYCG